MELRHHPKEMRELGEIMQLLAKVGYKSTGWEDIDAIMGYPASKKGKVAWNAVAAAIIMLGPDCEAKKHIAQLLRNTAKRRPRSKPTNWLKHACTNPVGEAGLK